MLRNKSPCLQNFNLFLKTKYLLDRPRTNPLGVS